MDYKDTVKPIGKETKEVPKCPEGHRWCPIKERCVPEEHDGKGKGKREARGKGKGPMGTPNKGGGKMSYAEGIIDYLDSILDEAGTVDDGEPNALQNNPEQQPEIHFKQLEDDIAGEELEQEVDDIIDIASEMVDRTLIEQDSVYQTYFREVMKKHGVTGIKHMSPAKKKEFFKDVSNGWKKHKKVKEGIQITLDGDEILYLEYKKCFGYMMNNCGIEDFNALTEVEQAEFMSLVNEGFYGYVTGIPSHGAMTSDPTGNYGGNVIDNARKKSRKIATAKSIKSAARMDEGWEIAQSIVNKKGFDIKRLKKNLRQANQVKDEKVKEQMQKPGAPIENPMSTYGNMIDKMKNELRPERKARQMAVDRQRVRRPLSRQ